MALPIPELAPVTMAFCPCSGDLFVIGRPSRSRATGVPEGSGIEPRQREAPHARPGLVRHLARQRAASEAAVEDEGRKLQMHVLRAPADAVEHDSWLALQRHPASLVRALAPIDHDR